MALVPHPPEFPGEPGDKIQHMIAFFTLGVLAAAGWRDRRFVGLFVALAGFGAAIELFQAIPALHRDAELGDWLADMAATVVALGVVRLALGSPRQDNGSDA
jgi:VanZ family protein